MKSKLFMTLLIFGLIMVSGSQALAARGCAEGDPVDATAIIATSNTTGGHKYYGTMTIYFEETEINGIANMHVFVRLGSGNDLWSFGYIAPNILFVGDPYVVVPIQQAELLSFVENEVIPFLFYIENNEWCVTGENGNCPSFALKSVDNIIEDMVFTGNGLLFTIMDFTLAVKY